MIKIALGEEPSEETLSRASYLTFGGGNRQAVNTTLTGLTGLEPYESVATQDDSAVVVTADQILIRKSGFRLDDDNSGTADDQYEEY